MKNDSHNCSTHTYNCTFCIDRSMDIVQGGTERDPSSNGLTLTLLSTVAILKACREGNNLFPCRFAAPLLLYADLDDVVLGYRGIHGLCSTPLYTMQYELVGGCTGKLNFILRCLLFFFVAVEAKSPY